MTALVVILGYVIGSIPTAYVAGKFMRGKDIRQLGDGNVGAQNAFRQLSPTIGILVGLVDAAKGSLAILFAHAAGLSQPAVFLTGGMAVAGHNWPIWLGFRGGRGEATTVGILFTLITIPMALASIPATIILVMKRNVTMATAVGVIVLLVICLWQQVPTRMIVYSVGLFLLVAFAHVLSLKVAATRDA